MGWDGMEKNRESRQRYISFSRISTIRRETANIGGQSSWGKDKYPNQSLSNYCQTNPDSKEMKE